ncbi:MAG: hypothetical protein HQK53_17800 [Oligoflexia bacterium]|nr:hypothetical protein [Oligoflexia bacterium]
MKIIKLTMLTLLVLLNACAFTDYKEKEKYISKTTQQEGKKISISIMTVGGDGKLVGHIKNGFGMETADIKIPVSINELIQDSLQQECAKFGYKIADDAPNRLLAKINQIELEFSNEKGKAGYYSVCDLQVYFKTENKLFERNIVENDKIDSYWFVTAREGVENLYNTVNKCVNLTVQAIEKKVAE